MSKKAKFICLLILIVIIVIIFYNFYSNYVQKKKLESRLRDLQEEIETTRKENEELKVKLDNIDDMEYIEKIAREKLGLVKPGETLLIPVEEGKQ